MKKFGSDAYTKSIEFARSEAKQADFLGSLDNGRTTKIMRDTFKITFLHESTKFGKLILELF